MVLIMFFSMRAGSRLELIAFAVNDKRMPENFKVEILCNIFKNFLNARVAKFKHLAAIRTNQVVVLLKFKRLLELCHIPAKLVLGNQVGFDKQLYGVVQCGPADPVFVVFHLNVQRLYIKMTVAVVYLLENGKALGCFAVTLVLKVLLKKLLYIFVGFFFGILHKNLFSINLNKDKKNNS